MMMKKGGAVGAALPVADVPMEDLDMAQRTHPIPEATGSRLARTTEQAVQLHAQRRVEEERRAAYRRARTLTGDVLELVDQLDAEHDPSERIHLQESAREAAAGIVALLVATGTRVEAPRAALSLDQAVDLLDSTLGLAEVGLTGGRHVALGLALIVQAGVEDLAGVEPLLAEVAS